MSEHSTETVPQWTVADRLRKAREARHLSQQQLAELTGFSRRSVSSYESGAPVKRPVLIVWALVTGVPVEWLKDGINPTNGRYTDDIRQVAVFIR